MKKKTTIKNKKKTGGGILLIFRISIVAVVVGSRQLKNNIMVGNHFNLIIIYL